MIRPVVLAIALASGWLAGCQPHPDEERMSAPPPPPATLIAPVRASMSLEDNLLVMERELTAAIDGGLRDEAVTRMFLAEAISDGLLEAQPPFAWLARNYALESRLRQIQVRADRIVAMLRRSEPREHILPEVVDLRAAVAELRRELDEGGGEPPISLDSLLAGTQADSLPPMSDEPIH
jgi:hypothetical protein